LNDLKIIPPPAAGETETDYSNILFPLCLSSVQTLRKKKRVTLEFRRLLDRFPKISDRSPRLRLGRQASPEGSLRPA
jgi:hypothetical protein